MDGKRITLWVCVAVLLVLTACKSAPPVITDEMNRSPSISRRPRKTWTTIAGTNALIYYRTFLEKFPQDFMNGLFARYEVAFILYKKQEYQESKKLFQEILETYKTMPNPLAVPQWPKVLAEKLITKIDQKLEALLPTKNEPKLPEQQPLPPAQQGIVK